MVSPGWFEWTIEYLFLTFIQVLLKDERWKMADFLYFVWSMFERYVIVQEKMSGLAWFKLVNWRLHAKRKRGNPFETKDLVFARGLTFNPRWCIREIVFQLRINIILMIDHRCAGKSPRDEQLKRLNLAYVGKLCNIYMPHFLQL